MSSDLSFLVEETFRLSRLGLHNLPPQDLEDGEECWSPRIELTPFVPAVPSGAGLFFHLALQGGTFIARTLPSGCLEADYNQILAQPEDYPTLRLVDDSQNGLHNLAWFTCESLQEAQLVHQRIGHRRFPLREEEVCNLSDPGFSWWMEKKPHSLTLHSKISVLHGSPERLGPLADARLAPRQWAELSALFAHLPLDLNIYMDGPHFHISSSQETWLVEIFTRLFREGEMASELHDLFRLLAKRGLPSSQLAASWFFLKEIAVVRRFWVELQSRLPSLVQLT